MKWINKNANETGKNDFQAKFISWSYRIRGKVVRAQINKILIIMVIVIIEIILRNWL
jgi:hypothetical protein